MRYPLIAFVVVAALLQQGHALAWDGFDADTADLVEITPDTIPPVGASVDVRDYDNDTVQTCNVVSVTRNRRTIEVVVLTPEGKKRILVMEAR